MFNGTGYNLSDIAAVTGGNNGAFGGGNYWWIIILFFFFFVGGDGFRNNNQVPSEISYGFDVNGINNGLNSLQKGLCDGFYAVNTGMLNAYGQLQNTLSQGFSGTTIETMNAERQLSQQLCNMQNNQDKCCCETQRLLERASCDLGHSLLTEETMTRAAINDSTRQIIDFLTQDKIASLTAENQALRFSASQCEQNAYLINALGPKAPIPAYNVPYPYSYNNCCGGSCGCGTM